jgi:uncharacterized protein (DUF2336 family)
MTFQYFIVGMMPNLESFDGFSAQLLGNQLCALGLSDDLIAFAQLSCVTLFRSPELIHRSRHLIVT